MPLRWAWPLQRQRQGDVGERKAAADASRPPAVGSRSAGPPRRLIGLVLALVTSLSSGHRPPRADDGRRAAADPRSSVPVLRGAGSHHGRRHFGQRRGPLHLRCERPRWRAAEGDSQGTALRLRHSSALCAGRASPSAIRPSTSILGGTSPPVAPLSDKKIVGCERAAVVAGGRLRPRWRWQRLRKRPGRSPSGDRRRSRQRHRLLGWHGQGCSPQRHSHDVGAHWLGVRIADLGPGPDDSLVYRGIASQ